MMQYERIEIFFFDRDDFKVLKSFHGFLIFTSSKSRSHTNYHWILVKTGYSFFSIVVNFCGNRFSGFNDKNKTACLAFSIQKILFSYESGFTICKRSRKSM